ncbi:trihelix transcription factor ASIL1-like [Hordeum vulgare subsp. vulgare]|uniref:Myb/SANT-like DNA-binding domain-containing protein n=1 Tax=Hordeum vulgare subsp. vulgare TaxID=112509 RepID=A0A8I6Y044_HORVV|nr:trihelix transcription factor ASIL1-like [Hordeum vulgare subsp. vulgare]
MSAIAHRRRRPAPPPPAWTPEPWSDGETSALLEAWGPRHLRAGGGPLRTSDWRACAAAVTSRRAADGRAPRTVDQCKNRMDYLKKRLRADRSRLSPPPPLSGSLRRLAKLLRQAPSVPHRLAPMVQREDRQDDDEETDRSRSPLYRDWPPVPKRRRTAVSLSPLSSSAEHHHGNGGAACTEVAAALDRLAGTYERVEAAKQMEATRLEERRLEAKRDLEIERMRVLADVAISTSDDTHPSSASASASAGGSLVEELVQ